MMTATRREWNELYVFFALLGQGSIALGDAEGKASPRVLPIARISRQEHDGKRDYLVEKSDVRVVGEQIDKRFPREDFDTVARLILEALGRERTDEVESPEGVEDFLDALQIYDMEARTDDRTDFYLTFHDAAFPPMGFRIYSRLCAMPPLLDGGRTANLKFEQTGVKFASPTVNKVNQLETPNEVLDRMRLIERLGGTLKYSDVADKVFRSNLCMIDLHFPRMLAEMLRTMYYEDTTRVSELTARIEDINPLKIKDELIRKHGFYRYKMKQFLLALALGMRPAKLFNGTDSAVEGFIFVDGDGRLKCYHKADRETFADFLFSNTRFLKGALEKDKYGYLERENGAYYFKLNAKIGFVKR